MKILGFSFKTKTKIDNQIDEIQDSIADKLNSAVAKMERAISRSMQVVNINGGKPELVKRDLQDISLYIEDIKNLASDLRDDARL